MIVLGLVFSGCVISLVIFGLAYDSGKKAGVENGSVEYERRVGKIEQYYEMTTKAQREKIAGLLREVESLKGGDKAMAAKKKPVKKGKKKPAVKC